MITTVIIQDSLPPHTSVPQPLIISAKPLCHVTGIRWQAFLGGHDSAYITWPWTNPSSVTRQLCDLEQEPHLSEVPSASSANGGAVWGHFFGSRADETAHTKGSGICKRPATQRTFITWWALVTQADQGSRALPWGGGAGLLSD